MGDKIKVNLPSAEGKLEAALQKFLNNIEVVPDEKDINIKATFDDNASKGAKKLKGNLDETISSAEKLSASIKNVGNASAGKTMEQTGKVIENSAKKTVANVSKAFANLSNVLGKSIDEKKVKLNIDTEDIYANDIDKSLQKEANSKIKAFERIVKKYQNDINTVKDEGLSYKAKGKQANTVKELYKEYRGENAVDLFDKESVTKSTNEFMAALGESKVKVSREIVELRESLYAAYQTLSERVNFNETDFSNSQKNSETLRNARQMVEIAKQIDYIDKKIGVSNDKHTVDTSYVVKNFEQLADKMTNQDSISKIFSRQYESAKKIHDSFMAYITDGLQHGFDNVDTTKYFTDIGNAAKSATKEVKALNDEVKNPNSYISDKTKLEGSAINGWNKLNKKDQKLKGKGLSEKGQWAFVGQIANVERNGGKLNKDSDAYKYYLQLLEKNEELRNFANEIMGKQISGAASTTTASVNLNAEKVEEEIEKQEKLTSLLERAKELNIDVGQSEGGNQEQVKNIDDQIAALEQLIEVKEKNNQVPVDGIGESSQDLESDATSFITTVSKLENYASADPQWIVDYTDKIRNREISLSDALDDYKNKLSTKMQEIADEQERNRANNEQVKLFAEQFGDVSNLDADKLSKYTKILNQISSGVLSAADGIEQFNAALNEENEATGSYEKLYNLLFDIKNVNKSFYSDKKHKYDWIGIYGSQEEAISEDLNTKKNDLHSSLNLILSEDKQELKSLEAEANKLQYSLQPVQDIVNRISSNSSIMYLEKNPGSEDYYKKQAEAYKEIDDRLGVLRKKYELTNEELEEFVTLQLKAEKIIDSQIAHAGGVQGSGARDRNELVQWIEKTFARDLGFNPEEIYNGLFSNITDALYDHNLSLYDSTGKKRNLRGIAGEILGYKGATSSIGGELGVEEDSRKLRELNTILSYIKSNADEINNTDFSEKIKKTSDYIGFYKQRISEGKNLDYYTEELQRSEEELQRLLDLQERLNNARGGKSSKLVVQGDKSTTGTSITSSTSQVDQTTQEVQKLTQAEIECAEKAKEIGQAFGITNKNALKEIQDVLLEYKKTLETPIPTDENGFLVGGFDDELDLFANAGTDINTVLDTISKHIKTSKVDNDAYLESWKQIREYVTGSKIHISDKDRIDLGDNYQSVLSTIGRDNVVTDKMIKKDSGIYKGQDIISFLSEMNGQLGTTFDLSMSTQNAIEALWDTLKVKPAKVDIDSLPESIRPIVNQILDGTYGQETNRKYSSPKVKSAKFNTVSANVQEQESAQSSVDAVENAEQRKQEAYKQTAQAAEDAAGKTIASEEKIQKVLAETLKHNKECQDIRNSYNEDSSDPHEWDIYSYNLNRASDKNIKARSHLREMLGLNDPSISAVQGGLALYEFDENDIISKFGSIENAAKELHNALEQGLNIHDFIANYQADMGSVEQATKRSAENASDNSTDSRTQLELYKQEQQAAESTALAVVEAAKEKEAADTEATSTIVQNSQRRQQAYEDDVEHWYGEVEDTVPKDPNRRVAIKTTDSDTKQSTTYQRGKGRTTEEGFKLNKKTNEWEPFYNTLTNMVQVENEAVKWTNKLALAQADLDAEMREAEPAQNVLNAINRQIAIYQEILDSINQRANELASEENSPFSYDDYRARVEERTNPYRAEIDTKTEKQIRAENEKAVKEQEKLEELQSKYTKKLSSINGGFKHLTEYTDVQSAISGLVDPNDVSQVEAAFNRLEKVINDFKQNVKSSASLDPIFNAMKTRENIDSIVDSYEKKFIELGMSSDEAKVKVEELFNIAGRIKGIDLKSGTGMSSLGEEINKFNTERNKLDIDLKTTKSTNRIDKNVEKAYKQLADTEERYLTLVAKEKVGTATKEQIAELKELNAEREKAYNTTKQKVASTQEETAAQQRYNEVLKQSDDVLEQYVNKEQQIKSLMDSSATMMNNFVSNNKKNLDGFDDIYSYYNQKVTDANNKLMNAKNPTTSDFDKYKKEIAAIQKDLNSIVVGNVSIDNAEQAMRQYFQTIGIGADEIGKFDDKNKSLTATFKDSSGNINKVKLQYDSLTNSIKVASNTTEKAKSTIGQFLSGLKGRISALGQYLLSFASFYEVINVIKQGVTVVRDLDTALTEMRKVSDESTASLKNFQSVSFDIASNIGSTAKQIQNSAADFMRLGYSLDEASNLAEDANVYANVGDMDITEATEHMISSIQAWKSEFSSEVEASEAIIDRYNEIGNNFAITSADIGSAMERSAAALKAGGNTLNESLGLITAGNLVQQDADTTANALKVMSLRIRGSKTELEDMGESTDDLASSTSKLREEILALSGVDIMKDNNTYKSTAQIIQEIGTIYNQLSDVSQASLLEKLAGKTRASTVAGLLENYKVIGEVIESAENADGSALEENARYMDSIEGKIQQFTNEVQEFWYNVISSDAIKKFIDAGTKIMDLLGNIVSELGLVKTAAVAAFGIFGAKKIVGNSGGRVKKFALKVNNMPPNRLAERCASSGVHWSDNILNQWLLRKIKKLICY